MASASNNNCLHLRSVSLPSKSNPVILKIEKQLEKLKVQEESSTSTLDKITIGLLGLSDLYKCVDEVLSLPLTQQVLSLKHHEKNVHPLLDVSTRLLHICTSSNDIVSQLNETCRDLQSVLQNSNSHRSITEGCINNYVISRKNIMKSAKLLIRYSLKQVDDNFGSSAFLTDDHRLTMVIKALRCVSIISISVFESLLFYLSVPVSKPKSRKWSTLTKLMNMGSNTVGFESHCNELHTADGALHDILRSNHKPVQDVKFQRVCKSLEVLQATMGGAENGLGRLFKELTKIRASLLNIISYG